MALFQTSVLKTYLAKQDNVIVERAYKKHTKYFHNFTTQKINITLNVDTFKRNDVL